MRILSARIRRILTVGWRRYICDEDPDHREDRLRQQALEEIDAKVQMAMQVWKSGLKQSQEFEVEAA